MKTRVSRTRRRVAWLIGLLIAFPAVQAAEPAGDGALLRESLLTRYPSLRWVERYRAAYPQDAQGDDRLWHPDLPPPALTDEADVVRALVGLEDQHVALTGSERPSSETLGVLFRTASDARMIVWRVFDATADRTHPGDEVVAIDGVATARWLAHAAASTFGGNRRSRVAEAALELGIGTVLAHRVAGLGRSVRLGLRSRDGRVREERLGWLPMTDERARAMTAAVDRADLPTVGKVAGRRFATLRVGAFAPQYDPRFDAAADAAAARDAATDDDAMVAGFCAVVDALVERIDALPADLLAVDLRGNLGGFGREARLLATSLAPRPPPRTFDVVASSTAGLLGLTAQPDDPPCRHVATDRPLIVLVDAGTRSAGELMATRLWAAGAFVAGERTIGAGGGRAADSAGLALPGLGIRVRASESFAVFDPSQTLSAGAMTEEGLLTMVSDDGFAPSRTRPFAIQAVGLRPDVARSTSFADLRDGGAAQLRRLVATFAKTSQ